MMPSSIVIDTPPPSMARVVAALRDLGLRKAGDAVGDRLDAGQCRRTGGERPGQQGHHGDPDERVVARIADHLVLRRVGLQGPAQDLDLDQPPHAIITITPMMNA